MQLSDNKKIGLLLTAFGLCFTLFGVLLMFDRGLLAIGNLLFLAGVTLTIGPRKTVRFFFQRHKLKGTGCFLGGIVLVFFGWTFVGMILEAIGFFVLFGSIFPFAIGFLRRVPIIGSLLSLPYVSDGVDKIASSQGGGQLPV